MEGKGRKEGRWRKEKPLPDVLVLADQGPQARRLQRLRYRDLGQHHLHSQVRSDPPGRSAGARALPQLRHVQRADVLGDNRQRQRWRDLGQRRQPVGNLTCGSLACRIFFLTLVAITGCSRASDADWQRRYSDAQSKFRFGYTKEAHYLADAGYQASLKTDQIWNWRFRILKAQISLRQNAPEQAINLLASEPPPNSPPDVSVRTGPFQGYAFCRLNKPAEAEAALAQADSLAKSSEPSLGAEIAYARGVCTMPRAPDDSQRSFAQAAQLAHGRDAFIEANALNNIGYLHLRTAQYDAAIQEFNRWVNLTDSYLVRA